jgi:hypothetical protein
MKKILLLQCSLVTVWILYDSNNVQVAGMNILSEWSWPYKQAYTKSIVLSLSLLFLIFPHRLEFKRAARCT